jgi:predicted nucleic acid-binding protein
MIVLDANILIRAILGRRVRHLLDRYAAQGLRFFAAAIAFDDAQEYLPAQKHLPALLKKRGKPESDVPGSLAYLRTIMEPIDRELYAIFEGEARNRLRGRDEDDWPGLASALALGCGIWSEDADFFGTGIAVWTTSRMEIFLKSTLKSTQSEQD